MVIGCLIDTGLFTLHTPIEQLLPENPEHVLDGITVAHLLSHTSGLRDVPAYYDAL